jgi:hypothetical protein
MLDFLKNVVKSKAFKELLRVLVALLAGYAGSGCSPSVLSAAKSPEVLVFECQLAAVVAFVPPAVAEDVVMALRTQNFEYATRQLLSLGLDVDRVRALAEAYDACAALSADAPVAAPPELVEL